MKIGWVMVPACAIVLGAAALGPRLSRALERRSSSQSSAASRTADGRGRQASFAALYSFAGGSDCQCPHAEVVRDPADNLNGTTVYAGTHGSGIVFALRAK